MTGEPAIAVSNVRKTFWVHTRTDATLLSRIADAFPSGTRRMRARRIDAVRNIHFTVERGEVLGLIGENAAGKSTLLRLIAGIHTPDEGTISVNGTVTSLINLSAGLQHRLPIHDNIFLACSLFGMQRSRIQAVLPSIIEFAGLEGCLDMYPYQLSLGMNQRLAFSIAVHTDPEILLLDEVFSAGDAVFQKQASERMESLIRSNVTVVMASHELGRLQQLCNKILWLESGSIRAYGEPKTVMEAYTAWSLQSTRGQHGVVAA